ncbi:MAG: phosphate ABC transporter substrate-binding protein PstS [Calditrichaeota bacterium]|nr:phosphate ABC transporter substrate-binding protein PstS [Calditrichota bacterium]
MTRTTFRIAFTALLVLVVLSLALTSCKSEKGGVKTKKVEMINGAGATFPYPIYGQWAYKYEKLTGIKINYQSIGSGGGVAQIKAKTVDFGASDAPLTKEELDQAGLIQFPMVIGGVVPVVNLQGVAEGSIKFTPQILADIYLGKINKWNDPILKKLNPDVNFPEEAITTVHRADGSGTTWIFTNYLSKISPDWKEKVGFGKAVAWPRANSVAGKGNEGVASFVRNVNGAIGYVEYAYALQNKMNYVQLQNKDGNFVKPVIESFQAAAANADWANAPGYYLVLTNQPGAMSWPITGASFILMHKIQKKKEHAKSVLEFFDWCYRFGSELAKNLHYVPVPAKVYTLIETSWKNEIKSTDGKPVWDK